MSLDVYLTANTCEHCGRGEECYSANITHNMNKMAKEAGIYELLWRPDEIGVTKAKQIIEPLARAIAAMELNPSHFEKFNPENGWGSYSSFLPWLKDYLAACIKEPEASVSVSR